MKRLRITAVAAGLLAAAGSLAYAAGLFPGFPIVGQAAYTEGLVTVPAGPTAIGAGYMIPADTRLSGGQAPQTVLIPVEQLQLYGQSQLGPSRNLLRGGDISSNPFQRGTSELSIAAINNSTTSTFYTADGFSMRGVGLVASRQTGASSIQAGQFSASLRMRRQNTADTNQVCQHNVVTTANSLAAQGKTVVYSFWAHAGANFSPANSAITANIITGTGTDQSPTSMQAGTWTGQATPGTSTLLLTTTWTQYSVAATVASTATQVGVEICWTPSVGAGTTDFIETANHQLEITGSSNVTSGSAFQHESVPYALQVAQHYYVQINESPAGVGTAGSPVGLCTGTATFVCQVNLPVVMRQAGTTSAMGSVVAASAVTPLTAGSFKISGGSGAQSTITSPTATNSTTALMQFTITNTNFGNGSNGQGNVALQTGSIGTGILAISAEL